MKVKDEEVEENGSKADNEMETDDEQDQLELNANTTVFVKNLNFDTTEESLRQKFASRFKVRSVTISKKRGNLVFFRWRKLRLKFIHRLIFCEEKLYFMNNVFMVESWLFSLIYISKYIKYILIYQK